MPGLAERALEVGDDDEPDLRGLGAADASFVGRGCERIRRLLLAGRGDRERGGLGSGDEGGAVDGGFAFGAGGEGEDGEEGGGGGDSHSYIVRR